MPSQMILPSSISQISNDKLEVILAEAEVVKVATEVMDQFSSFMPPYYIRINHTALLEAFYDLCGIEPDAETRSSVSSIIGTLGKSPWSAVRGQLISELSLTEPVVDDLQRFVQIKGEPKRALSAVESLLSPYTHRYPDACHRARHAVAHTSKLLQAMDDMTVPLTLISFDASMSLTRDFSAGLIFQVVVVMGDHRKLNCVAVGGRWDRLVDQNTHSNEPPHRNRRHRRSGVDRLDKSERSSERTALTESDSEEPSSSNQFSPQNGLASSLIEKIPVSAPPAPVYKKTNAVGLSFAVDKIIAIKKKRMVQRTAAPQEWPSNVRLFDIFVASPKSLFAERLNITSKLWENDLRVDYWRNRDTSLEEQKRKAIQSGVRYLLVLEDESFYSSGMVKVIDLDKNNKLELVHKTQVSLYFKKQLGDGDSALGSALNGPNVQQVHVNSAQLPRREQQIRASYFSRLGINQ
jgi:histidyl-tRNA synthetase